MFRSMSVLLIASVAMPPFASAADKQADGAAAVPIEISADDWPWWRGPGRNGIANPDQTPPLEWNDTKNVVWSVPVPGRGHGGVTTFGDFLFLATAEKQAETESVLCFDRASGKRLWKTDVHKGGLSYKGNKKASLASSTIACDGERLYIGFLNDETLYATALTLAGDQVWQTEICKYVIHQGYGASPAIYGSLVIITGDNKGGSGVVAGLDRKTGDIVWKNSRPKTPNYSSPIILNSAGKDQLFLTGCDLVTSLEPLTGKTNWEFKGATTECVTSTVTDGRHIYTTGGYPKNHVAAVRTDGSKEVAWENKTRVYVPSMIARNGYLYAVADAGFAVCWKADTGEEAWKARLGGTFSSSPVLVGENLFVTNEAGKTFIFKADPSGFKKVGENDLGDNVLATPTICGSRIYMRVAFDKGGSRREMLYCLGE